MIQPAITQNLSILALADPEIFQGVKNLESGHVTLATPLQGRLVVRRLKLDIAHSHTKLTSAVPEIFLSLIHI